MVERYDLAVSLNYRVPLRFRGLLQEREWVRGVAVDVKPQVINKSSKAFPGCKATVDILEHGQHLGPQPLQWTTGSKLEIPKLESGESATLESIPFVPLLEGLCQIRLTVEEQPDSEIWVQGWRLSQRRGVSVLEQFYVVGSQQLEIIRLLRSISRKGDDDA